MRIWTWVLRMLVKCSYQLSHWSSSIGAEDSQQTQFNSQAGSLLGLVFKSTLCTEVFKFCCHHSQQTGQLQVPFTREMSTCLTEVSVTFYGNLQIPRNPGGTEHAWTCTNSVYQALFFFSTHAQRAWEHRLDSYDFNCCFGNKGRVGCKGQARDCFCNVSEMCCVPSIVQDTLSTSD